MLEYIKRKKETKKEIKKEKERKKEKSEEEKIAKKCVRDIEKKGRRCICICRAFVGVCFYMVRQILWHNGWTISISTICLFRELTATNLHKPRTSLTMEYIVYVIGPKT